jgi:hypothetical protein
MEPHTSSRRYFIQRITLFGAMGAGATTLLSACGSSPDTGSAQAEPACTDVSGLTDPEVQARQVLDYVESSPYPERLCDNCQFWIDPEPGTFCGGCQLIKGPINPKGYCISWAETIA